MPERTQTIEIHNVFFNYAIGITHTAIWTKPKGQWADLPNYLKLQFSIDTPPADADRIGVINKAIRDKVEDQKRTGQYTPMKIEWKTGVKAQKFVAQNDQLFLGWETTNDAPVLDLA